MKSLVAFSALFILVTSTSVTIEDVDLERNPFYGYLTRTGVPLAEKIRAAEAQTTFKKLDNDVKPSLKIIDGKAARLGEIPYQAGIIINLKNNLHSVCGGTLLNAKRVLTAAHCWYDGINQVSYLTVVLGSIKLYSDGTRMNTTKVVPHTQWKGLGTIHDIAMVHLPNTVKFTNTIQTIALPSGKELQESFVGYKVIASGFGRKKDGELPSWNTYLSYVQLKVIDNAECAALLQGVDSSSICTKGVRRENTCTGDSGGPVALTRNNKRILIGVNAFGGLSCETGQPTGYKRVTYYINWIKSQL